MSRRTLGITLAAWWLWMPAAGALLWLMNMVRFSGMRWRQDIATFLRVEVFPDMLHPTPLFWLWVTIGLAVTAGLALITALDEDSDMAGLGSAVAAVLAAISLGVFVIPGNWSNWHYEKRVGQYYNRGLVVHIQAGQAPPSSLYYLMRGVSMQNMTNPRHHCVYVNSTHDVPSCTVLDNLQGIASFEGRTSSFASAKTMMSHANTIPGVSANLDTINYLYGPQPKPKPDGTMPDSDGTWTSILDGKGNQRHAYGVASWDGKTNTVTTGCAFNDSDDKFDRAFAGAKGNSLTHWLANKYPDLHFDLSDAWGYCPGGKPAFVLPATDYDRFKDMAMSTPAGPVVLTGSDHGVAATYHPHVKAGQFPGPVYPASIVTKQQDVLGWAAGRKWQGDFGFAPTSDREIQGENTGNYMLRGDDGRLYFVTPLTPASSSSQMFTAFGVTRADVVNTDGLNTYNLNVLPANDAIRSTNLNTLANNVTDFIRADDNTFLNTGGSIQEMTPLGGDMWRAFAVRRGIVEYYVDLSANNRVRPRKVVVHGPPPNLPTSGQPTGNQPVASGTACGKPATRMTTKELADCLAAIALRTRTLK